MSPIFGVWCKNEEIAPATVLRLLIKPFRAYNPTTPPSSQSSLNWTDKECLVRKSFGNLVWRAHIANRELVSFFFWHI